MLYTLNWLSSIEHCIFSGEQIAAKLVVCAAVNSPPAPRKAAYSELRLGFAVPDPVDRNNHNEKGNR